MMSNSVRYTIGTALSRGLDTGASVQVLVQGHWISGSVLDVDSDGVVLQAWPHHFVVRLADITAVQVEAPTPPELIPVESAAHHADTGLVTV